MKDKRVGKGKEYYFADTCKAERRNTIMCAVSFKKEVKCNIATENVETL